MPVCRFSLAFAVLAIGYVVVDSLGVVAVRGGRVSNRCLFLAHFVLSIVVAMALLGQMVALAYFGYYYYNYEYWNYGSRDAMIAVCFTAAAVAGSILHCARLLSACAAVSSRQSLQLRCR